MPVDRGLLVHHAARQEARRRAAQARRVAVGRVAARVRPQRGPARRARADADSGLTFAPEAGTQRMRDVVNKNVTEEHIEESARRVFSRGWHRLKLYFMIGLPTEEDDDVRGIVETGRRMLRIGRELVGKRAEVTVSVSSHVPKPHTPFQWCAQDPLDEIQRKQAILRDDRARDRSAAPQASRQRHLVRRGRARARRSPARRRDRARVARRRALRRLGRAVRPRALAARARRARRRRRARTSARARSPRGCRGITSTSASRTASCSASTARRSRTGRQPAVRQGRRHAHPPHEPRGRRARSSASSSATTAASRAI